jgi:hypothetical protein
MSDTEMKHLEDDMSLMFEELDLLRESNTVNMLHGITFLRDDYGLSRKEAWYVFDLWSKKLTEVEHEKTT